MDTRETTDSYTAPDWIKGIVVAADGSPASLEGLNQVAELAKRTGAKVTVAFVRHLPTTAFLAPGIVDETVIETLDDLEHQVREEGVDFFSGTGIPWKFVVREGSPGEEIVKVIVETDADLVVVGSNRHSSLHNLLLGSTAAYLATHSPAPVLVMRVRAGRDTVGAEARPRSDETSAGVGLIAR
jgi:nucleotide-binding universal stress UspA family protein